MPSFEWLKIKERETKGNPPKFQEFPIISGLFHKKECMISLEMYRMKMGAKVLRLNYNNVNINKIDMRSEAIDDMYRLILVS